jgi:hypothetical protein
LSAEELLPLPDAQPYLPRLSGAGSLRHELEAVLDAAPPESALEGYRDLILERNAAGKRTASMRTWTWKRMKVRYLLDPRVPEFRAFRRAMSATADPGEQGLVTFLMMARTDRLFREVTTDQISIHLSRPGVVIDAVEVRSAIETIAHRANATWSASVIEGLASHVLSSAKDFGLLRGSRPKRTVAFRPGPVAVTFAVELSRLEGLSDRRTLESRWFRLLGLGLTEVLDLMRSAARQGALGFRFQADVAEIVLPEPESAQV